MSVRVVTETWSTSEARGSARLVLLALADCAESSGTGHISIEQLGAMTRVPEAILTLAIGELIGLGELQARLVAGQVSFTVTVGDLA